MSNFLVQFHSYCNIYGMELIKVGAANCVFDSIYSIACRFTFSAKSVYGSARTNDNRKKLILTDIYLTYLNVCALSNNRILPYGAAAAHKYFAHIVTNAKKFK